MTKDVPTPSLCLAELSCVYRNNILLPILKMQEMAHNAERLRDEKMVAYDAWPTSTVTFVYSASSSSI